MKRMALPIILALGLIGCNPKPPSPNNPSLFLATPLSTSSIDLNWSSVDGATGYNLERKSGSGSYANIASPSGINHTDTGLSTNTSYTYRLKAVNASGSSSGVEQSATTLTTNPSGFKIELFKDGLSDDRSDARAVIWSLNFAPDGRLLFTMRDMNKVTVKALDMNTKAVSSFSSNASVRYDDNPGSYWESGVLGMELDPGFNTNKKVYICYSYWNGSSARNRVSSFVLSGTSLGSEQALLNDMPGNYIHNGCRIIYGPDAKLYISMGDADNGPAAQNPSSKAGKIFRINPDGSMPSDNPFAGSPVWTLGHRNPQGLAFKPGTNELWSTEHGPEIRDELNIIKKGKNYGWPNCMGTQTPCAGVSNYQAAIKQYEPDDSNTIAPSDMVFYTANAFPQWKGSLFFVTLKTGRIYRLVLSGETISSEERIVNTPAGTDGNGPYGRIRDITVGPEGYIYFSNDSGQIYRIVPQ